MHLTRWGGRTPPFRRCAPAIDLGARTPDPHPSGKVERDTPLAGDSNTSPRSTPARRHHHPRSALEALMLAKALDTSTPDGPAAHTPVCRAIDDSPLE